MAEIETLKTKREAVVTVMQPASDTQLKDTEFHLHGLIEAILALRPTPTQNNDELRNK